jgi:hypothetical protein
MSNNINAQAGELLNLAHKHFCTKLNRPEFVGCIEYWIKSIYTKMSPSASLTACNEKCTQEFAVDSVSMGRCIATCNIMENYDN